jgi:hypothetical protein
MGSILTRGGPAARFFKVEQHSEKLARLRLFTPDALVFGWKVGSGFSGASRTDADALSRRVLRSRYLRQTIVFSSINSPDINALVKKNCHNITGNLRTTRSYPGVERDAPGLIPQVSPKLCRGNLSVSNLTNNRGMSRSFVVSSACAQQRRRICGSTFSQRP